MMQYNNVENSEKTEILDRNILTYQKIFQFKEIFEIQKIHVAFRYKKKPEIISKLDKNY